jgi:hypothetical protein
MCCRKFQSDRCTTRQISPDRTLRLRSRRLSKPARVEGLKRISPGDDTACRADIHHRRRPLRGAQRDRLHPPEAPAHLFRPRPVHCYRRAQPNPTLPCNQQRKPLQLRISWQNTDSDGPEKN